jgi:hypothetical protein
MLHIDPYFLFSIRSQTGYTWQKMICELIDNSFDAEATLINISFPGGKVFSIEDNGIGCRDLNLMLNLGSRFELENNDIGKYGVGCKLAMIWLWGRTHLETCYRGHSTSASVNWQKVALGEESFPPAIQSPLDSHRIGTFVKCFAERAYPKNLNSLRENIASTYTPAIENGCKILWNVGNKPHKLSPRKWPDCYKEESDIVIAAGRSVSVKMGIVREGVFNPYQKGFSFERTYRVIMESPLGSGEEHSVARIAAKIQLGKEWDLSTNKDELLEFQEDLGEAIQNRFGDLIREGSEQAVSFEDQQFNKELAIVVSVSAKTRREQRHSVDDGCIGTVEPKETGRKRQRATESIDEPGSVIDGESKRRRSGFSVECYTDDSDTFGYYDRPANRVRLNVGNEWLASRHREQDKNALLPVIYGILSDYAVRHESEKIPLFREQIDNFSLQWGSSVAATMQSEVSR